MLIQGCLALMIAHPAATNGLAVLQQLSKATEKFVSDRNFIDMLRVMQVAIVRGQLAPDEVPGLRRQLAEEFPAGEPTDESRADAAPGLSAGVVDPRSLPGVSEVECLRGRQAARRDAPAVPRIRLDGAISGWRCSNTTKKPTAAKGAASYARYVINATRDFCKSLSEDESRQVLAKGDKWPNAALGALYKLPQQLDAELLAQLIDLDGKLARQEGDSIQRLQVGIVAVLARSGDEASQAYLRKIWDTSPERRQAAALGLAQKPAGENWFYLVRSLPMLEPAAAAQICSKLTDVDQAPEEAEPYRQAILLGLKMRKKNDTKADAAEPAIMLLSYWTGEELAASEPVDKQLAAWQKWFAEKYPDQPEAEAARAGREREVHRRGAAHVFERRRSQGRGHARGSRLHQGPVRQVPPLRRQG